MRLTCIACGKLTIPFAFIGGMAVGPRCAKRMNLSPTKIRKGSAISFAKPVKRDRGPTTIDMFEDYESNAPLAG